MDSVVMKGCDWSVGGRSFEAQDNASPSAPVRSLLFAVGPRTRQHVQCISELPSWIDDSPEEEDHPGLAIYNGADERSVDDHLETLFRHIHAGCG